MMDTTTPNLYQLSNDLKNLSDQQLTTAMHAPSVPPFLVVAEMKRRQSMRTSPGMTPPSTPPMQKTVTQDLLDRFRQGPVSPQASPGQPGMGAPGAAPPTPPNGPPPQGIAALANTPTPGMARGGQVRGYGDDGLVGSNNSGASALDQPVPADAGSPGPASGIASLQQLSGNDIRQMYPAPTMADIMGQLQSAHSSDQYAQLAQELEAQKQQESKRKRDPWRTLSQFGFAMAAAPTHSFGRAMGEAGLAGQQDIQEQDVLQRALALQNLTNRIVVAKSRDESQNHMAGIAATMYDAAQQNANQLAAAGLQHRDALARLQAEAPYWQAHADEMKALAHNKDPYTNMAETLKNPQAAANVLQLMGEKVAPAQIQAWSKMSDSERDGIGRAILSRYAQRSNTNAATAAARLQAQLTMHPLQAIESRMVNTWRSQGVPDEQIAHKLQQFESGQMNVANWQRDVSQAYSNYRAGIKDIPLLEKMDPQKRAAAEQTIWQSELARLGGLRQMYGLTDQDAPMPTGAQPQSGGKAVGDTLVKNPDGSMTFVPGGGGGGISRLPKAPAPARPTQSSKPSQKRPSGIASLEGRRTALTNSAPPQFDFSSMGEHDVMPDMFNTPAPGLPPGLPPNLFAPVK